MENNLRDSNGRFSKGNYGFWAGKKRSKETNEKIRKTLTGKCVGEKSARWNGGVCHHGDGYIFLMKKDHPRSNEKGYVFEHVLVAENKIGRFLLDNECVHHINGIRNDNRSENLIVLTKSEHAQHHSRKEGKTYEFDNVFLQREYLMGKTIDEIALENNSTYKVVRSRLLKFGVKLRPCGKQSKQ